MRTASELVRATLPFAREVRWRSWWHLWSTLAVLTGLLLLNCVAEAWWSRLPVSILAGLVMVRLFTIYHDHQHGTILRRSLLARVVLDASGLLLLTPPSIWRRTHHYHHSHNARLQASGVGSFRVMTTRAYARAPWRQRLSYAIGRHPLTILAGYVTVFLYGMCLGPFLHRPRQHLDGAVALLIHAALVAGFAVFAPDLLLWVYLVPLWVAMALGSYLFYAQHNFPGARFQEKGSWDHAGAALGGSSYMVMGPLLRWFTGNIGYHHVHHLNARIPFYRLPEAMAHLEELRSPQRTSLSPVAIFRCLRLKLWDPEKQRLVDFAGR